MQKETQQTTVRRATDPRAHGALGLRPMHRRLAVVGVLLLIGVWTVARNAAGPGPGESP